MNSCHKFQVSEVIAGQVKSVQIVTKDMSGVWMEFLYVVKNVKNRVFHLDQDTAIACIMGNEVAVCSLKNMFFFIIILQCCFEHFINKTQSSQKWNVFCVFVRQLQTKHFSSVRLEDFFPSKTIILAKQS